MFDYFRTLHQLLKAVLLKFEAASGLEPSTAREFACVDGVAVNIRIVRFAARADPPCCRFSSTHQKMLHYGARESSDVFLCTVQSRRRAVTSTTTNLERRTDSESERPAFHWNAGGLEPG